MADARSRRFPVSLKGLGVTLNTMAQTMKPKKLGGGAATVQYPHEKETPPIRARGVIALREDNCTVVHALRAQLPRLVHLHRGATRSWRRRVVPVARRARSTSSTASTSTTRCACTAASASRCARSTRCSGARSTSTASRRSPTCCTTRPSSASGWRRCPRLPRSRPAPRRRRASDGARLRHPGRPEHRLRHHRR